MIRPLPPTDLALTGEFRAAPELSDWLRATFLEPDSPMANEDHAHLLNAHIGALWTSFPNSRQMRVILATAEQPTFRCGKWQKARQEQQMVEWFGDLPDFVLTFRADWAADASDAEWCAVVEHELYHCAQDVDIFGMPKFHQDGTPSFAIKGHDVEEFIGVVRRYGAVSSEVRKLIEAANTRPSTSRLDVAAACGTCLRAVA